MSVKSGVICLAVYQPDEMLLRRQIDSLRNQSLSTWTCLVGIDGSNFATEAIVETAVAGDDRFKIYASKTRLGFYRNFERLLADVPRNADWVALCDQDDRWYPEKLERLVARLPQATLVSGQARLVHVSTRTGLETDLKAVTSRTFYGLGELVLDNAVSGALAVFRTELLEVALPFPGPTDVAYHDHWLGICAALLDGILFLEVPVQDYVQHEQNVVGEEDNATFRRFSRLLARAKTQNVITYMVAHRWGWRVNMGRSALIQCRHIRTEDRQILEAFAKNRFNLPLLRLACRSIRDGNQSRLRVLALLCASVFAPLVDRRRDDR